jgi:hypothetical protein
MRNDAFSLQLRNSLQPRNDAAQHVRVDRWKIQISSGSLAVAQTATIDASGSMLHRCARCPSGTRDVARQASLEVALIGSDDDRG